MVPIVQEVLLLSIVEAGIVMIAVVIIIVVPMSTATAA